MLTDTVAEGIHLLDNAGIIGIESEVKNYSATGQEESNQLAASRNELLCPFLKAPLRSRTLRSRKYTGIARYFY